MLENLDNSDIKQSANSTANGKKVVFKNMKDDPDLLYRVKIIDKHDKIDNLKKISKPFFNNYGIGKQLDVWFDMADNYGRFAFDGGNGAYTLHSGTGNTYFSYTASKLKNSKYKKIDAFEALDKNSFVLKDGKKVKVEIPEILFRQPPESITVSYGDLLFVLMENEETSFEVGIVKIKYNSVSGKRNTSIIEVGNQKVLQSILNSGDTDHKIEVWIPLDGSDFETNFSGEKKFLYVIGQQYETGVMMAEMFDSDFLKFVHSIDIK